MEIYLKNNHLIRKEEWIKKINNLRSKELIKDKKQAKKQLKKIIIESIKKRIPGRKFGVLFSGGVDSSLITFLSQKLGGDFICYTVGFQDGKTKIPQDIVEAKKVAKKFNFPLKYKIFNLKEAEGIIKKTISLLKKVNKVDVVNIGVGAVILAALELGKKDKINCFFSGLGSEELFAGYERHRQSKKVNQECWKGLKEMWERDLVRDFNLAKSLEVKISTPFLDQELIKYALKLPADWKISKRGSKLILREVAAEFLGKFAWRQKKAAQYGSCFDKALEKLAKKEGFKSKGEWLKSLL